MLAIGNPYNLDKVRLIQELQQWVVSPQVISLADKTTAITDARMNSANSGED